MLDSVITTSLTLPVFLLCTAVSLFLGLAVGLLARFRSQSSGSLALTLALLPAVVQLVIMLVNGNIGAGVAVAGAFGLVRFRSVAGSGREIVLIFLAMALGLATGMGYVLLAALFFLIVAAVYLVLSFMDLAGEKAARRKLKITIPEQLDYEGLFDDVFARYTKSASLEQVRTSNMGTLYELQYSVVLKGETIPREFLDELRCRNGNLNIVCGRIPDRESL